MKDLIQLDEIEIGSFKLRFNAADLEAIANVNEVDMNGWILLECFVFDTVIYFGWDEETRIIEWIDMEADVPETISEPLEQALIKAMTAGNLHKFGRVIPIHQRVPPAKNIPLPGI
jgi:hypothetical protein